MRSKKEPPRQAYEDPRTRSKIAEAVQSINRLEFACGTILGVISFVLMLLRGELADKQTIVLQDIIHSPYFSLDWLLVLAALATIAGLAFIIKSLMPLFKILK